MNFFVDFPLTERSPLSYLSRPPIMLRNVVLPQPDGPSTDTNSFLRNSMEIPLMAGISISPTLYDFVMF